MPPPLLPLLLLACLPAFAAEPLPALRAQKQNVTASGLSSGGYMAVQLHLAHSASVSGVGVIAGGPYYCAQGSLWTALNHCMTPGAWSPVPSSVYLKQITDQFARTDRIDPTKNLAGVPVWLFSGKQDRIVSVEVVRELRRYYDLYGARTVLVNDRPAGHAMVTEASGNACAATETPFINHCDYDAAGELLRHLLGKLDAPSPKPMGRLATFDQKPYGGHAISMDDSGLVYIPKACEGAACRIHVAFHGCRQNAAAVGERFAREAGYNRWADTNRLIVLYPQTVARYWWLFNPRACWDWWGYTGPGYPTRDGAQVRAVKAMIDRLAAQ
jgi:poly(3-hydroxybutyrate) depolymerase